MIKIANKIAEKPKSSLIEIKKLISNNLIIDNDLKEERNFGKPELRKSIPILTEEQNLNANILVPVVVANGKI